MKALVVYESMYGNTHTVADHVAEGLRSRWEVRVVPVGEAAAELVAAADLLVVGGPTHAHGMTRAASRRSAVDAAAKDDELELDPDAEGPGLREWFHGLPTGEAGHRFGAAFDTRVKGPAAFTGRAAKGIAKRLAQHRYEQLVEAASFLVDNQNHLLDGEAARATTWGESLGASLAAVDQSL